MSRSRKFLFNCSNIHVGGGVQVAASVICEWSSCAEFPRDVDIWVSTEVHNNIVSVGCDPSVFKSYEIVDSHGWRFAFSIHAARMQRYAHVLTLFGPLYQLVMIPRSTVGFAQFWILQPDNPVARRMTFFRRSLLGIKFRIQKWFFARSDALVVELDHVAGGLVKQGIVTEQSVTVVRNCVSSVYAHPDRWKPLDVQIPPGGLKLGYLGRNYPHKNLCVIPEVKRLLSVEHNMDVDFYVTMTEAEWAQCDADLRNATRNVGQLSIAQCPEFYRSVDGVFFPSLLECFSATPLEALTMGKPLFASDRVFNRAVCGDYADYFDPEDVADIARAIASHFKIGKAFKLSDEDAAKQHAREFSSPRSRADRYLEILRSTPSMKE